MINKYYKIGKNKNRYIVLKYFEYNGKYTVKEMYFSKSVLDCINFCRHSNYIMKGFVEYA